MICTACQKAEAVVFIKQLIKNQVSEAAFCAACAAQAQVPLDPLGQLAGLMQIIGQTPAGPRLASARCPDCGLSWQDFKAGGRFGCAGCYDHFAERLRPLIPRLHSGSYAHRGKTPKRQRP
jgi:protein arginine kinase activator